MSVAKVNTSFTDLANAEPRADFSCIKNRLSPIRLEQIFVEITKALYMEANELPEFISPVDDKNCPNAPAIIASGYYNSEDKNAIPAIVIDVGQYTVSDLKGYGGHSGYRFEEASYNQISIVNTSIVWVNIGRSKYEAMNYAAYIYDVLDAFTYPIKHKLNLENFRVSAILKVKYDANLQQWSQAVQAVMSFRESAPVIKESQKLKTLEISINTN